MDTNSVTQKNIGAINLPKSYNWLENVYTKILKETLNDFWEIDFDLKLVGICENENFFYFGSEYFATRIKLSPKHQCTIRLSKETIQVILDACLGYNQDFKIENLTELEAKILTAFNNLIYSNISQNLYTKEEIDFSEQRNMENVEECHLTFFLKDLSENPAKIIISIPKIFLKYEEIEQVINNFEIGDFPNVKVTTNIFLGSATLPLNDIKNLEAEDIIVLEKSNINNMTLISEGHKIEFKVSPDPSLIISFDNNNEGNKDMSDTNNIWDNIQVDISAEFEKAKITLGEIKQLSEGLVLDMGSLYENKVYLKVENKVIAEGELVIINDRYGVKIDNIIDEKINKPAKQQKKEAPKEELPVTNDEIIEEEPQQEVEENTDEFDYKDFDIEDENI